MVFGDKQQGQRGAEPAAESAERDPNAEVRGGDGRGGEARGVEGFAKRAIEAGVMRMLQTEEGLRALAGAVVPRELVGKALDGVDTVKGEAVAVIGRELRTFLANLNVGEEMAKILTSVSFEVKMQVRFVPNEDGTLRAQVRSDGGPKVSVGEGSERRRRKAEAASGKDGEDTGAPAEPERRVAPQSGGFTPAPASTATGSETGGGASRPTPGTAQADEVESTLRAEDPARGRRSKMVKDVAMRLAERTAATARAAAEVAADAAAEVVNRSLDGNDDDDDHELDSY